MDLPTIPEPLQDLELPDVRRPERMPSWPAWAASRVASLKIEMQPHPTTGKWTPMPTLPKALMLTIAEREALDRHLNGLRRLRNQTPVIDPTAEKETLMVITKMVMAMHSAAQNELSAEARGEAFMIALEDIPVWATWGAIRRWYRGDCGTNSQGKPYDYRWHPAPAELRHIAWTQMSQILLRMDIVEQLLDAVPLVEFRDDHCRNMRQRLQKLFGNLESPLVGKDGSGGGRSASG